MSKDIAPVIFVGHGSPMNALQDNPFTRSLQALGASLARPRAIVCVSAHWVSDGTLVTADAHPRQIYDFYGFPEELYHIAYRPKGEPSLAQEAVRLLGGADAASLSSQWGIDHGTWTVLMRLFPACDIPVIQIGLDRNKSEADHMALAKLLAPLRRDNVLIVASGNIVHNLGIMEADQYHASVPGWAHTFDDAVCRHLEQASDAQLPELWRKTKNGPLSVPTNEHYLPLLYAAALRLPGENVRFVHQSFQHGTISMRSFILA